MKLKKITAMLLASALILASFAACSEAEDTSSASTEGTSSETTEGEEGSETTETTTIDWYYPIDASSHHDVAWEAVNAHLEETINVTVDYNPISWGEYETKTNTIKSSGQDFDIMFQNGTYSLAVSQGVAQPIDQYLDTVGADVKAALPESLWAASTIEGSIYGVPTYKDNATVFGIIVNKTIADEIGLEIPESFPLDVEWMDTFYREANDKLVATYGEDHGITISTGMEFMDPIEQLATRAAVTSIEGMNMYQDVAPGVVFDVVTHPETTEYYQTVRTWVEDGIIPFDGKNVEKDPLKNDGKLFSELVIGYVDFPVNGWSDNYETQLIPTTDVFMTTGSATAGVNLVGANSENPEAAVAFLNSINTDAFVANTIRFGTEGEYFTLTEDDRIDFTGTLNADPAARTYYQWYGWQFGNIFAMNLPAEQTDTLFEDIMAANESAATGDHMGLIIDTSSIQNEIAACEAIYLEYRDNLAFGMIEDVEATMQDMITRREAAGIDKIVEEVQNQVNAHREANGLPVAE